MAAINIIEIEEEIAKIEHDLAASVLSQRHTNKITGKSMETKASMVMKSNKYSDVTKSLVCFQIIRL